MLSAAELASMRAVEATAMSSTAIIYRYTPSADGLGGFTQAWAAVGTVVCDLWPANRGMQETPGGAQLLSRGEWYITVPYDTVVTAKDRIKIGSRSFEVTFVPNNRSWDTGLRVEANSHNEELRT